MGRYSELLPLEVFHVPTTGTRLCLRLRTPRRVPQGPPGKLERVRTIWNTLLLPQPGAGLAGGNGLTLPLFISSSLED